MPGEERRTYRSVTRRRQADETRTRIANAARKLLETSGYAGMTVDAIAQAAEVSPQTVYAIFGSKTGILVGLMEEARFGTRYEELVQEALATNDPYERMRFPARIARQIYDAEDATLTLLRGAGAVAPKLAKLEEEQECQRYESQQHLIGLVQGAGALKPDLDVSIARDLLWMYTGRDLYRMLVGDRGWPSDRYEAWLADTLVDALLVPRGSGA